MKSSLELYKEFTSKTIQAYEYGLALQAYSSIDEIIENPTDEEFETIFSVCYEAYMKSEDSEWLRLIDGVTKKYSENEFTLEELKKMSKYDIYDLEIKGAY